MSNQMINTIFQFKRGKAKEWLEYSNSTKIDEDGKNRTYQPKAGEPCFEIDTGKLKIGDGDKYYDELDYASGKDIASTDGYSMILNNPDNKVYEIGDEGYGLAGGQNSASGCKGYYIKAIVFDFDNTPGYHMVFLSNAEYGDSNRPQVELHNFSENTEDGYWTDKYQDTNINFDERIKNKTPGFAFSGSYIYKGTIITGGKYNYIEVKNGNIGFDKSVDLGKQDPDEGIFFVPEVQDYGKFTFANKGFAFGEQGSSKQIAFLTVNSDTPTAAIGRSAAAFGRGTIAMNYAGAFGRSNVATNYSFVAGQRNLVTYSHSAAFGVDNRVDGYAGFAAGSNNVVTASQGFAAGSNNIINGAASAAFGTNNIISSASSLAAGEGLRVDGQRSVTVGKYNEPNANYLFTVGCGTTDTDRRNALWVTSSGTVEVASQGSSNNSVVIKSTIQPMFNLYRIGDAGGAAAIGSSTASGGYSFAAGLLTEASAYVSSALGYSNKAIASYSLVCGKWNQPSDQDLFQIGNGTKDNRSNAFVVCNDGHAEIQTQGTTDNSVVQKKYVDDAIANINVEVDMASDPYIIQLAQQTENAYNKAADVDTKVIKLEESKIPELESQIAELQKQINQLKGEA